MSSGGLDFFAGAPGGGLNGLAFGMSADVGQYGDQVKRGAHSDVRHI